LRRGRPGFAISALKIGDAARVAPIDKLSIVLVAVFALRFGERLTASNWLGIVLIGCGRCSSSTRAELRSLRERNQRRLQRVS